MTLTDNSQTNTLTQYLQGLVAGDAYILHINYALGSSQDFAECLVDIRFDGIQKAQEVVLPRPANDYFTARYTFIADSPEPRLDITIGYCTGLGTVDIMLDDLELLDAELCDQSTISTAVPEATSSAASIVTEASAIETTSLVETESFSTEPTTPTQSACINMLANAGFEDGLDPWTVSDYYTETTISEMIAKEGSSSM